MKFYAIGDADTVLGFNLAGVEGVVAESAEEIDAALKSAFQKEDLGIIIITERAAQKVRHEIDRYTFTTSFPLIIEIPDRKGSLEERGSVRDLIRSAVGVRF
ncbi:V-type ATP synthase subunit F [bacterium]|nr:V-type ATP synthase subunit F [bacterium]